MNPPTYVEENNVSLFGLFSALENSNKHSNQINRRNDFNSPLRAATFLDMTSIKQESCSAHYQGNAIVSPRHLPKADNPVWANELARMPCNMATPSLNL